ncbi:sigma-70 family RNA polymerase sigma factor [Streptomyces melanogenes]|uniref:Sigma-70 family RNA polymerase sigma factor n=1 Tax=Streptomyces melanogenes TaxID=67326 RepID=A0ABZ1XVL6_9ACTN|nr:sigma-70 family RNA polymerase sigma factor [Streptomyces melanogenes]
MDEGERLAERFEANRTHLRAVAYRILGNLNEADDAVQEAWLRLSRTDASGVKNLGGWLTTVVGRVCLDMLRSRDSRRELLYDEPVPVHARVHEEPGDPEHEVLLVDSVGLAMLVVLNTLAPAERIAFVLHDMFMVPFDEIAAVVGRSTVATRQLASRARRRVQESAPVPDADLARQREVVDAFFAASRAGDFDALLELLDPDVVVRADRATVEVGAMHEVRGALAVAGTFKGRAQTAQLALVDGTVGAVWAPGGCLKVVLGFTLVDGRITEITLRADPDRLRRLDLAVLAA